MDPLIWGGVLLYGSLYLVSVMVAGLCWGFHAPVILAIMSLGVSFLCYAIQGMTVSRSEGLMNGIAAGTMITSWALAIAAGVMLL